MGVPRLMNPNIVPPRPGMPAIVPPWAFTLPPGMPPLGLPPPNPAAMTAMMSLRPPPGIFPPMNIPKPSNE